MNTRSNDPDVSSAAARAAADIAHVLESLPAATRYDYGGHFLSLDDYSVCQQCTGSIAEAQQAAVAVQTLIEKSTDPVLIEHYEIAAEILQAEAFIAKRRAMLHGGHGSEPILNGLLGFIHERHIHDSYDHSHVAQSEVQS